MQNFTPNTIVTEALAAQAAGQGTDESAAVDMAGHFNLTFIANATTVVSGGTVSLSLEARDDPADDWQALAGSVSRDSAGVLALEVENPSKRYVRAVLTRADENVTTDGVLALQRRPSTAPVSHDDYSYQVVVSPEPA